VGAATDIMSWPRPDAGESPAANPRFTQGLRLPDDPA